MLRVIILCAVVDNIVHETSTLFVGTDQKLLLSVKTALPYKYEPRVVGGQPAPIEKYPFAVQVAVNGMVTCGGTLVTQKHVISAAHCGFQHERPVDLYRINLRVGTAVPLSGGFVYFVQEFIMHPSFSKLVPRDNDIAIFITKTMVAIRDSVMMASIAPAGYEAAEGATVVYIGWGYLGNGLPQAPYLQEVPVQVVNWTTCRDRYQQLGNLVAKDYTVSENMFCAGILDVGGQDACGGDSGGPVIEGGVVVGIISWGMLCAEKNYPGVNTKVSRYFEWIDDTVEKHPGMLSSDDTSPSSKIIPCVITIMLCLCLILF